MKQVWFFAAGLILELKNYTNAALLINNYPGFTIDKSTAGIFLNPWQAVIIQLN